jgi:mannose-1-phosphate guanylyltransferase
MQACVLVGGKALRLGPLTASMPKCLLTFGGRPFLELLLGKLHRDGCTHVVLVAGHLGEQLVSHLPRLIAVHPRVTLTHAVGGTYAALRQGMLSLEPCNHFLCLNGDTILDVSYSDLYATHIGANAAATLVTTRLPDVPNRGAVSVGPDGYVNMFSETATAVPPTLSFTGSRRLSNCGCYLLRVASCLDAEPAIRGTSIENDFLPYLVAHSPVLAYDNGHRYFLDFGTTERLALASASVKDWMPIYS